MLRKNFSIHIINHHLLYIRPIIGRYYLKDGALQILANCLLIETEKESLFLWLFAVSK